jgi:sulfotransferase family protein
MATSFNTVRPTKRWMEWINVPPVFIVGCPRSGTTLLSLMLTAHPEISITPGGGYIYRLRSNLCSYGELSDPVNVERLHRDLIPGLQSKFLNPPALEQFFDWVKRFGTDSRSIITFYGTWKARVLEKTKLAWWGYSASHHVHHIPYLATLFPQCKFILIVRDPRDVFASGKVDLDWDFVTFREEWEKSVLDGLLARLHIGATNVKEMKYETLVTNPKSVLQEICDFLQVEYTDEMLAYGIADAAKPLSRLNHLGSQLKPVCSNSIGRYRQVLTQEETDAVRSRLYGPMKLCGYICQKEYEEISRSELSKVNVRR